MKIFITSAASAGTQHTYGFPESYRSSYLAGAEQPYTLVDSAKVADLIVYWKFWEEAQVPFCPAQRVEENLRRYPEKCYVVSHDDSPIPFFPGVYTSLTRENYDYFRHRTGCYGITMNPFIAPYAGIDVPHPKYLASFTGSLSHPVRKVLLSEPTLQASCQLQSVPLFSYGDSRNPALAKGQEAYAAQMAESRFALCPRGGGTSSHRLFEAMQMGRCPVILSDDWMPPEGPAWIDCSIRVAERNVKHLHTILSEHEPRWRELGHAARREWEQWFSPEVFVYRTLQSIVALSLLKTKDERHFQNRWKAMEYKYLYDLSKVGRGVRKLRRMATGLWEK